MEDQEKRGVLNLDTVRNMSVMVSIPLLAIMVIGTYQVGSLGNQKYVQWHDNRYAKLQDAVTLAQAHKLDEDVRKATAIAQENQRTLKENTKTLTQIQNSFEAYAAVATVNNLRQALDRKEMEEVRGSRWREERDRLARQVEQAEAFRDCVLKAKTNCHLLRPDGK